MAAKEAISLEMIQNQRWFWMVLVLSEELFSFLVVHVGVHGGVNDTAIIPRWPTIE
jgi:hypothetical protein